MRSSVRGATAVRISAILTAVVFCLTAVAYASTRGSGSDAGGRRPLRPRIVRPPSAVTAEPSVEFDFSQPSRPARSARPGLPLSFECRLDEGPWEPCEAPVTMWGIALGPHRVQVHAVNRAGVVGPWVGFTWRRVSVAEEAAEDPAAVPETAITPDVPSRPAGPPAGDEVSLEQVGSVENLLPGSPAQTIGVRVVNPSSDPISVTSLSASIPVDPPDCPAGENFVFTPAALSPDAPLSVPAESTLSLADAGIVGPAIAMLNLPIDQDPCVGAELQIALSAEVGE